MRDLATIRADNAERFELVLEPGLHELHVQTTGGEVICRCDDRGKGLALVMALNTYAKQRAFVGLPLWSDADDS